MPQNPRNRQEFLRMQEQAMAAAREMQRRATLPAPPVAQANSSAEPNRQRASAPWGVPQQSRSSSLPHMPLPPPESSLPEFQQFQSQPLHHHRPSQQARQNATYGRSRPQAARSPHRQNEWQPPAHQHTRRFEQRGAKRNQQPRQPPRQSPPKCKTYHEPPPSASPPPPMPPLSELFSMLGGFGNMGGTGAPKSQPDAFETAQPGDESMDSILTMVLLLLLRKENADQGLMMALMYIMM